MGRVSDGWIRGGADSVACGSTVANQHGQWILTLRTGRMLLRGRESERSCWCWLAGWGLRFRFALAEGRRGRGGGTDQTRSERLVVVD